MKIFESVADLRAALHGERNVVVGFVPTMGALHEGHISLVERARRECSVVVVSIFVNPTQFNDKGDLKSYPRTPDADCGMLRAAGVDYVFMPTVDEVYPHEDIRRFDFGSLESVMEGATRPGHFNGVAQVVSRLFDIVAPNKAYFGQKDFQQVAIIHRLVEFLSLGIEIIEVPTFRGEDGLALSSRNALLTAEHRAVAPTIYRALNSVAEKMSQLTPAECESYAVEQINATGLLKVIYLEIVDSATLCRVSDWSQSSSVQLCTAVQAGEVRLIDNLKLK